jgi:hypothetical protein
MKSSSSLLPVLSLSVLLNLCGSPCATAGLGLSDLSNAASFAQSVGGTNTDKTPKAVVPSPLEALARGDVKKPKQWGQLMGFVAKAGNTVMSLKSGGISGNAANVVSMAGDVAGMAGNAGGGDKAMDAMSSTVSQRRQLFSDEPAFLDAETEAAGLAIATREQKLLEIEKENQQREIEIAQLEASTARTKQDIKAARASLKLIDKKITENNQLREQYQSALAYLDESLKSSSLSDTADAERKAQWQQKIETLTAKRTELAAQSTRVQGVCDCLDQGKGRLTALVAKN